MGIFEVDENLDRCVDWNEFQLMFKRNLLDTTGYEPSQLFNVAQFMMFDEDNSGKVTADETMQMLLMRYGKDMLETKLKEMFGEDMKSADGDGELDFGEYIVLVNKRVPRRKQTKSVYNKPVKM